MFRQYGGKLWDIVIGTRDVITDETNLQKVKKREEKIIGGSAGIGE